MKSLLTWMKVNLRKTSRRRQVDAFFFSLAKLDDPCTCTAFLVARSMASGLGRPRIATACPERDAQRRTTRSMAQVCVPTANKQMQMPHKRRTRPQADATATPRATVRVHSYPPHPPPLPHTRPPPPTAAKTLCVPTATAPPAGTTEIANAEGRRTPQGAKAYPNPHPPPPPYPCVLL
jgi:hypothetical protein